MPNRHGLAVQRRDNVLDAMREPICFVPQLAVSGLSNIMLDPMAKVGE